MNSLSPQVARKGGARGRPSKQEEGAITAAIVNAALKLFLANGFGATSMKRIGEEAGVAPNTLYARFPDKASLFAAVVEWKAASWKVTNPPRRFRPDATLQDILEGAALHMLEAIQRDDIRSFGRMIQAESGSFPELARIYGRTVMAAGRDDLIAVLTSMPGGPLTPEDAEDLTTTLRECVAGHSTLSIFGDLPGASESLPSAARRIARSMARNWSRG